MTLPVGKDLEPVSYVDQVRMSSACPGAGIPRAMLQYMPKHKEQLENFERLEPKMRQLIRERMIYGQVKPEDPDCDIQKWTTKTITEYYDNCEIVAAVKRKKEEDEYQERKKRPRSEDQKHAYEVKPMQ